MLFIWIKEKVGTIEVEGVEREERGRCPGVPALSCPHQTPPASSRARVWGGGPAGQAASFCSEARVEQADGDTAQRVQQTAGCRFWAVIPWGRQVRVFLDERTVADETG